MKEVIIKLVLEEKDNYEELKDIVDYISKKLNRTEKTDNNPTDNCGCDYDLDKAKAIISGVISHFKEPMNSFRKLSGLDYLLVLKINNANKQFECVLKSDDDYIPLHNSNISDLIERNLEDAISILYKRIKRSLKSFTYEYVRNNETILYKTAIQLTEIVDKI